MPDNRDSRRKQLAISLHDRTTGKSFEVYVSYERMRAVGQRSMGHAKECGYIVPAILESPTAIFEGLKSDFDEDRQSAGWRCYCGIPQCAYTPDGSERSAYPGQVYLVFVNEDRVAYNWRWEKADQGDLTLPQNHQERFRERVL